MLSSSSSSQILLVPQSYADAAMQRIVTSRATVIITQSISVLTKPMPARVGFVTNRKEPSQKRASPIPPVHHIFLRFSPRACSMHGLENPCIALFCDDNFQVLIRATR